MHLLKLSRASVEMFRSVERELRQRLLKDPLLRNRVELLQTIPGVGEILSLTWALEVGEIERFPSIGQAVSYCGLCSAEHSSAGLQHRGPISKKRNRHLQVVLIEAAKVAPRWAPRLMEIRDRERLRGSKKPGQPGGRTSSGGVSDVGGPERSAIRRPGPEGGLKHGRCAATPLILAVVGLRHVLRMRPPSLMFRGQRWPKFKIRRWCETHPMLAHECLAPTAHETRAVAAL